jgi:hypothetical protein
MHGSNAWIDACFLSKHRALVFYNCTLETTRYRYKEIVESRAWENAEKLLPRQGSALDFGPEGQRRFENDMHAARTEFGGLTRAEFWNAEEKRIADSLEFAVNEEVTLHYDYRYGIGLHATLNVPHLTIAAVNDFVRRFQKCEKPYSDPAPLRYSYEEVGHWGLDANQIVEPKDYAAVEDTGVSDSGVSQEKS